MRTTVKTVRRIIREEFLRGVPEWQLRQDTSDYVDRIRERIKRYILTHRSTTGAEQRESLAVMNDVCDELEQKVYDVLEDSLFSFTRNV